jgi:hypothetical protein
MDPDWEDKQVPPFWQPIDALVGLAVGLSFVVVYFFICLFAKGK